MVDISDDESSIDSLGKNRSHSPSYIRRRWRARWLAHGIFQIIGLLVVFDYLYRHSTTHWLVPNLDSANVQLDWVGTNQEPTDNPLEQAQRVTQNFLQRSYDHSYAFLPDCPSETPYPECIRKFLNEQANLTSHLPYPWWFRTMLGDAVNENGQDSGLHGWWHFMSGTAPNYRMCAIEKIGSSQWRKVGCEINGGAEEDPLYCYRAWPGPSEDIPLFTFLRDPLERFLSGFLDKCIRMKVEGSCKPVQTFNNPPKALSQDPKLLFEAYVDSFPLNWDLHFFPQSMYCDGLHRHIHTKYDFVGLMGPNFYSDVKALGDTYGKNMWTSSERDRFKVVLENVFKLSEKNLTLPTNAGVETRAADKIYQYYSPKTVRRVLEYFSIDYVRLNLPVPAWAQLMLLEDSVENQIGV